MKINHMHGVALLAAFLFPVYHRLRITSYIFPNKWPQKFTANNSKPVDPNIYEHLPLNFCARIVFIIKVSTHYSRLMALNGSIFTK